jgi:hypothetical protein
VSRLLKFVPSLAVGLGGVGAALLWFYAWRPLAVLPSVVALLLGLGADYLAQRELDHDDPVAATKWIYGWALVPFALAIAGAGAVIVVAVALDPGEKPSVERKEIFSAAAATVGAFLVAAFIKDSEEADEKWIGTRFKRKFQARFSDRFPRQPGGPATRGELAVKEEAALGFSGWSREARRQRAEVVEEELAKG